MNADNKRVDSSGKWAIGLLIVVALVPVLVSLLLGGK